MHCVDIEELEEQEDPLVSGGSLQNNDDEEEAEPQAEAGEAQQQPCKRDSDSDSVFSVINLRCS